MTHHAKVFRLAIAPLILVSINPGAIAQDIPPYPFDPGPGAIRSEFENPDNASPSVPANAFQNACGSGTITPEVVQSDSADGSPYRVWMDYTHGIEGDNGEACGRQYWAQNDSSHPKYGTRFFYLLDGQGLCVSPYLYQETAVGGVARVRPAPECSPNSGILGAW